MSPKEFLKLSKRKFPKLLKIVPFLFAVPVFIFLYNLTVIKNISCLNSEINCDNEMVAILGRYVDSSFFALNRQKMQQELNKIKPVTGLTFHYQLPRTLKVKIETENNSIPIKLTLVATIPELSYNKFSESTESAAFFQKPSSEISNLIGNYSYTNFNLWSNGEITPIATESSTIIYLSKNKPPEENLKSIFNLILLINRYIKPDNIYILDKTIFLSRNGQPDIITSVPYSEGQMIEALQSLGFLTTMKSDSKIIDLRFKNPTIR